MGRLAGDERAQRTGRAFLACAGLRYSCDISCKIVYVHKLNSIVAKVMHPNIPFLSERQRENKLLEGTLVKEKKKLDRGSIFQSLNSNENCLIKVEK